MGWSINPNQLAQIDNNGHVTFAYHSTDTIYTVSYSDGTCNKSKQVLVHACSTPDVCNCTITPSGSANELPAETGDTEYEVVTYSSSNCTKSAPDILHIGGTDFLGSFRNENGKTYAKVKLENEDGETRTGRYLFMISNCRVEVEFKQNAANTGDCVLIGNNKMGNVTLGSNGGDVTFNAFGCDGGCMFYIKSAQSRVVVYTFALISPPSQSYNYYNGTVEIQSQGGMVSQLLTGATSNGITVSYNSYWYEQVVGNYTLIYDDYATGIHCETPFTIVSDPCEFIEIPATSINLSQYGGWATLFYNQGSANVQSECTGNCYFIDFYGQDEIRVEQNNTGNPRSATIVIKSYDRKAYKWVECGTVVINQSA